MFNAGDVVEVIAEHPKNWATPLKVGEVHTVIATPKNSITDPSYIYLADMPPGHYWMGDNFKVLVRERDANVQALEGLIKALRAKGVEITCTVKETVVQERSL